MTTIPIALQLYSVRDDCARDLPGVLEAVAEMGYAGVEFAGYYGYDAAQLRNKVDSLGLRVAGVHIAIETLLGGELQKTIDFNRTLGNRYLIVPGLPAEYTASREKWLATATLFNDISRKVRPEGMYIGYHNHYTEFAPLDGELPWDTFFGNTDTDVVMQFDTGNAMKGGADPLPFFEAYPGRARTVHLKEYSRTDDNALIGDGDVPWSDLFHLCDEQNATEWYIVEQETYKYPPLETVALCLKNLKAMGK